jgi:hypothetical protein
MIDDGWEKGGCIFAWFVEEEALNQNWGLMEGRENLLRMRMMVDCFWRAYRWGLID